MRIRWGAEVSVEPEGVLGESAAGTMGVRRPGTSWARRILLVLFAAHAFALVLVSASAGMGIAFWVLLALNTLAIAGLFVRTPAGWAAALLGILAAAVRWGGTSIDESQGLMALLLVAAAVFCVTAPSLRREHGIAG